MLKINKKVKIPLIASLAIIGGGFLYKYLTFIPEYSSATEISTTDPVSLPAIEGEITTKFGTAEQGYKTYMQEISLSYCQSLPDKTTGQLADGRDGKIYWVTVLGTGDTKTCWMTQDLDLDLGQNGPALTTENDGDNLYKGTSLDPNTQTEWTGGRSVVSANTGWPTSVGNPTQNINWYERDTAHGTEHTSLGNLYSYEAATAGTGHAITTDGGEAPGSICPAGWKLPLSGNSANTVRGSFQSLQAVGMTSNTLANGDPYYFQYGGYISGSLSLVGINGYYWSASPLSSNHAYSFSFAASGGFYTAGSDGRYFGFSVRCVMRDTSYVPPVAPSNPSGPSSNNPNISVTVPNIITLDVSNSVDIATESNKVNTGEFTTTVSSNKDYTISLNATTSASDATSLVNYKDGNKVGEIKTIEGNDQPEAGKSGWGIRVCTGLESESCTTSYLGLPKQEETNSFVDGTKGINQHMFQIGIGVGPELPSGTYSTNIQVTASQK